MKWLFIIDPLEGLFEETDTSLALIKEARDRGISVDTATIGKLYIMSGQSAAVLASDLNGRESSVDLDDYTLILMRKEPPYDLSFHYATHILSLSKTLVVNRPEALRDFNEKLIALRFAEFMPPTFVTSDEELARSFMQNNHHMVIKSLDSFQGQAVQKITAKEMDIVREYTANFSQPVMLQKFLDHVFDGDKRVLLLGEDFLGAAMRKPRSGYHANFASSDALKTRLTSKEQEAVDQIGPWLVKNGIHFAGLDFIGGNLTEINITCPTGITQISEMEGRSLAKEMVDYFTQLEKRQ